MVLLTDFISLVRTLSRSFRKPSMPNIVLCLILYLSFMWYSLWRQWKLDIWDCRGIGLNWFFFYSKIKWKEAFWKVQKSYSFLQHTGIFSALFFKDSYPYGFVYVCVYERLSIRLDSTIGRFESDCWKVSIMSKRGLPNKFLTCAFPFAVLHRIHHSHFQITSVYMVSPSHFHFVVAKPSRVEACKREGTHAVLISNKL